MTSSLVGDSSSWDSPVPVLRLRFFRLGRETNSTVFIAAELDRVMGLRTRSAADRLPLMDGGGVLSEPESDLVLGRPLLFFFPCKIPSEPSLDSGLSPADTFSPVFSCIALAGGPTAPRWRLLPTLTDPTP